MPAGISHQPPRSSNKHHAKARSTTETRARYKKPQRKTRRGPLLQDRFDGRGYIRRKPQPTQERCFGERVESEVTIPFHWPTKLSAGNKAEHCSHTIEFVYT